MAWLSVLKTAMPYLTTIVTAAVPAFQAKKDNEQILELQEVTRRNAESIRVLAEQLQRTITTLANGTDPIEQALKRARTLALISLLVALIALGVALTAVLAR